MNSGNADLTISKVGATDPQFTYDEDAIPLSLAAGETALLDAWFKPAAVGAQSASLTFTTNDPLVPTQEVALSGEGTAPAVVMQMDTLDFGEVRRGGTEAGQLVLANQGTASGRISVVKIGSGPFGLGGGTSFSLDPGQTRALPLTFSPTVDTTADDQHRTTLLAIGDLDDDTGTDTLRAYLYGKAVWSQIGAIPPGPLDFGGIRLSDTETRQITVQNTGTATLNVTSVSVQGDGAEGYSVIEGGGSFSLPPPRGGRTLVLQFDPDQPITYDGQLQIMSDDSTMPVLEIDLTGRGEVSQLSYGPVEFGHVRLSETSLRQVTITNLGNADVSILGIGAVTDVIVPEVPDEGWLIGANGGDVSFRLVYAPEDTLEVARSLSLKLDDPNLAGTDIALSGRGVVPWVVSVSSEPVDFGRAVKNNPLTGQGTDSTRDVRIELDDPELRSILRVRFRGQAYHQGLLRLATEEQRARGLPPDRWLARFAQDPRRAEVWQMLFTCRSPWARSLAGAVVGDDPGPVLLLRYEAALLHQLARSLRLFKESQAGGEPATAPVGELGVAPTSSGAGTAPTLGPA